VGTDRILLLLSPRDHEAAIETGMGNAGLVPEIDARRIAARLVSRRTAGSTGHALLEAVAAIVDSVEATRERRTPLPAGDADVDPRAAAHGNGLPAGPEPQAAPTAMRDAGIAGAGEAPTSIPTPGGRSRLPLAATIAGLVLLALALRRRRQMAATRPSPPRDPRAR
jgi:hypothetical protein